MLMAGQYIRFDSDLTLWATMSAPHGSVRLNSQVQIYGQVFADSLFGLNQIDFGQGAYIPFNPIVPTILINPGNNLTIKEGTRAPCSLTPSETGFPSTSGCKDSTIFVTLSSANAYPVGLNYTFQDITAESVATYKLANSTTVPPNYTDTSGMSGPLVIAKGQISVPLTFRIFDNSIYQGPLTFRIILSNPVNAKFAGTDSLADTFLVTILDDELGALVSFVKDTSSVPANTKVPDSLWLKLTDIKTGNPTTLVSPDTVWFDTLVRGANPAYDPTNYVVLHLASGSPGAFAVIPAGVSTYAIPVTIVNDGLYSPDRTFRLKLRRVSLGGVGGQDTTTVTIRNTNLPPTISVNNASASEGSPVVFTVSLSNPSDIPACFNWTTADSTGKAGKDYTANSGSGVCIQPGSTTATLPVNTIADSIFEPTEYFYVLLHPVSGIKQAGSDTVGVGSILNANPRPALYIRDTFVVRPKSGTTTMEFVVSLLDSATRSKLTPSGVATTFNWSTVPGTALADTDFAMASGTDNIPAGSVTDTIRIQVEGDPRYNPPLTFTVDLVLPAMVSSSASRPVGTGTIYSAIGRPIVSVSPDSVTEGDSGRKAFPFAATLLDSADGKTPVVSRVPISFQWGTVDGTALRNVDYVPSAGDSAVVPAGSSQTFFVPDSILGNLIHQTNRTFALQVTTSDPNAQGGVRSTTGTILDDDPAPLVFIDSATAIRDTILGSQTPIYFHVHLVDPRTHLPTTSGLPVTFTYQTANGTAVAGLDYVAASGTATIPAGVGIDSFAVQILGDNRFVPTNSFQAVLGGLSGGTFGQNIGVGTIQGGARKPVLSLRGTSIVRPKADGALAPLPFAYYLTDPLTGLQVQTRAKVFFYWSTFDSSAKANIDYKPVDSLYAFLAPSLLNDSLYVSVIGSSSYVPPRELGVRLSLTDTTWVSSLSTNWTAMGWILDLYTPAGSFVTGDTTVPENLPGGVVQVVVHLSGKVGQQVSLPVAVDPASTTAKRGTNFQLLDSVAVFPSGDTLDTIRLKVMPDNVYSDTLRVRLDLGPDQTSGIGVVNPSAITVSIANTDAPPSLSFQDTLVQVREGDTTLSVVLLLDRPSTKQVVGSIGVVRGSAVLGTNYLLASGGFSFPPLATRAVVPLAILDDHKYGPDRDLVLGWLSVQDSSSSRFDPVMNHEHVLIRESDARPVLQFQTDSMAVQDVARGVDVAVLLNAKSDSVAIASVVFDTLRGAASGVGLTPDSGYVATVDTGLQEVVFHVPFADDGKVGPDRLVHLVLRNSLGASIGPDSVLTILIRNTNKLPVVVIQIPVDSSRTNNPNAVVDWTVNGVSKTPSDTTLRNGWNTITKCYTDTAGNTGCDTHHVWADLTPPAVQVFKITGPDTHAPARDTTWWGKEARTRFGTDTVWYWVRDSIENSDGSWRVLVDTLSKATNFHGDSLFAVPVSACDSAGNCGEDTGWISLKQSIPVVDILTPPNGAHVVQGTVPVLYTVADAGKTWSDNASVNASQPGSLAVTECYTDDVGNTGCDTHTIHVQPVEVISSVYVDLNGDGMVDAAIVTLDSKWTSSAYPSFDFMLNDSTRTGQKPNATEPFYSGPSRGTKEVVSGDTFYVSPGDYIRDSSGNILVGPDGKPLTDILGDTAFGADGSVLRDSLGRVLYKVAGPGQVDSTRFLVPIVPPFAFGQTGFDSLQAATMIQTAMSKDSIGKVVTDTFVSGFKVGDQVPPVILSAVIHRVENYTDPDTLFIKPSEPIDLSSGKDWLQVFRCTGGLTACDSSDMAWVNVPADSVHQNPDGTYWFLVQPGDSGSINPNYKVRFNNGVSDTAGNGINTSHLIWATPVTGMPRPPLVRVTPPNGVVVLPSSEQNRSTPGVILLKATKGKGNGTSATAQWWAPGVGYGVDMSQIRQACPQDDLCDGPTLYINRPARLILYIYDLMGVYVTSSEISITQAEFDSMQPDQLDRVSLDFEWNFRTRDGHLVASGVYLWRIVSYVQVPGKSIPAMDNKLVKVGVKVK
jgi:hypothetical protein